MSFNNVTAGKFGMMTYFLKYTPNGILQASGYRLAH